MLIRDHVPDNGHGEKGHCCKTRRQGGAWQEDVTLVRDHVADNGHGGKGHCWKTFWWEGVIAFFKLIK